jgi:RNA polymerase-binding transcription factor DksA
MRQDEQLRTVLADLRQRAEDRTARLEGELEALARARRSSADDDEHDPEGVPLSAEWSRLTGLLESSRADARQAEDAMRRLEAGEYGICVSCRKPIPAARLEVRPFAERCVPCAS